MAFISCEKSDNGEQPIKIHERYTIESNLKIIQIDQLILDKTIVYPYVLLDSVYWSSGSYGFTLFPVKDTGYIKFKYYDSFGETPGPVQLRDSLVLNTPIDTTMIAVSGYFSDPRFYTYHYQLKTLK